MILRFRSDSLPPDASPPLSRTRPSRSSRCEPSQPDAGQNPGSASATGVRRRHAGAALCDSVRAGIESLGNGFLTWTGNEDLFAKVRSSQLAAQDFFRQLVVLAFRLVMMRVAEEKRSASGEILLHPPETSVAIRDLSARRHSIGHLAERQWDLPGQGRTDRYDALKDLFRFFHEGNDRLGIPAFRMSLFSPRSTPDLDGATLDNESLLGSLRKLFGIDETTSKERVGVSPIDFANLGSEILGTVYESLLELHARVDIDTGRFLLEPAEQHERKATGSYYTPPALIDRSLSMALDPLLDAATDSPDPRTAERALLDLRVCDPACGSGHFLIAVAERIAQRLVRLRCGREGSSGDLQQARREVISRCLYGVDRNPMAVALCQMSLWMEASTPGDPLTVLNEHIRVGDSLLAESPEELTNPGARGADATPSQEEDSHFQWRRAFPGLFVRDASCDGDAAEASGGGFDAVLGNPPWVSWSGRQKVDIEPDILSGLRRRFPSITRWPAAHSAFLLLSTEIVRSGGRVGLVLPKQMADLEAYSATRLTVTENASLVGPVVDAGEDAFAGVTQPVGLFVLQRRHRHVSGSRQPWPVIEWVDNNGLAPNPHLSVRPSDELLSGLLGELSDRPRFAAGTFGDPGVHTGNVSRKIVARFPPPGSESWAPVREGRDIVPYYCGPPSKWLWVAPDLDDGEYCTIRSADRYRDTPILIRQTANRPIAARHCDPTYFRNSLLGCHGVPGVSDAVVIAFLNSALYAVLHRGSARDANQKAFPQVKVRHLQAFPAIPVDRLSQRHGNRTLGEALAEAVRITEERAARGVAASGEGLEAIEHLVLLAMNLSPDLAKKLLAVAP